MVTKGRAILVYVPKNKKDLLVRFLIKKVIVPKGIPFDIWDNEEPDSFVYLLKKIRDGLNGKIIDKGMTTYQIDNDPCHLTYQWDTLFGITIVYPEEISSKEAIGFLFKYFQNK